GVMRVRAQDNQIGLNLFGDAQNLLARLSVGDVSRRGKGLLYSKGLAMPRREVENMFQRLLLAYDGSAAAKKGLERCVELLPIGSAALHVVAVGRVPEYAETEDEVGEAREQAEAFYRKRLDEALDFRLQCPWLAPPGGGAGA